ncbi:MAG: cupin domain-containing protein [Candidatus Aenigmarchaeota archaeon]|nr:cupin domain-containing protein [Candidatus Aenigmarchaeota archaeon]
MKFSMDKFRGKTLKMKVKDAVKGGKNIYKNIKGHENDINEVLIDLPIKKTGLKRIILCMNFLFPGKVNSEFKMTRGHKHNAEEIYVFLKGKGHIIIDKKKSNVKKGDLVTVPVNKYHRVINIGRDKLVFLTIFEKHRDEHLKKY